MTESYITVTGTSCEEAVINKSRFIGYAAPCNNESEALCIIRNIRENHRTATHHCYAYIIGTNSGIMRYSDDGEPGGTAGMPILDAMRTKGIVNCIVVVVRYFGGVLLGTGGLVRAYTQSAQIALSAAGIASMELTSCEYCEIPYSVWDKFRYAAEHLPVRIEDIEFGAAICFHLLFRHADHDRILPLLLEASERNLISIPENDRYTAWTTG